MGEVPLKGIPLGGQGRCRYVSNRIDLQSGDSVILMSDGFPELRNKTGDLIDYERAISVLLK